MNWSKNGRNYDRVRECISRLMANSVLALNSKAYGESGAISLIQNFTAVNDDEGKPTQGFYAQTAENSASLLDNDFIGQNRLIFASSDMGAKS